MLQVLNMLAINVPVGCMSSWETDIIDPEHACVHANVSLVDGSKNASCMPGFLTADAASVGLAICLTCPQESWDDHVLNAQVRELAMKKFLALSRAPLGSLRVQQFNFRSWPAKEARVLNSADIEAQQAKVNAERDAQIKAKAVVRKRRRQSHTGPHRISNK